MNRWAIMNGFYVKETVGERSVSFPLNDTSLMTSYSKAAYLALPLKASVTLISEQEYKNYMNTIETFVQQ